MPCYVACQWWYTIALQAAGAKARREDRAIMPGGLRAQAFTPFGTTRVDNLAAGLGAHPGPKAVGSFAM